MKLITNYSLKIFLLVMILTAGTLSVNAQTARLQFDNLDYLSGRAQEVIEVSIDGRLLALAKRVLQKMNDVDARKVGEAINGLEGIYVRVYNFENTNEYNAADMDLIRSQLDGPGWVRLANVRSKKKNQKIDVFTMFSGEDISGVAVVISEDRSIALVNVVGPIDLDLLVELSGKLNIPRIDVETEENPDK